MTKLPYILYVDQRIDESESGDGSKESPFASRAEAHATIIEACLLDPENNPKNVDRIIRVTPKIELGDMVFPELQEAFKDG